jgi:hypothetical protein
LLRSAEAKPLFSDLSTDTLSVQGLGEFPLGLGR